MLREEPELRPTALEVWQSPRFHGLAEREAEPAAEGLVLEELLRSVTADNFLRAMKLPATQGGYLATATG